MIIPKWPSVLLVLALGSPALSSPLSCRFVEDFENHSIESWVVGEPGADPEWVVQTVIIQSADTFMNTGTWAGIAAQDPNMQVAEINMAVYQNNNARVTGFSILAAPATSLFDEYLAKAEGGEDAVVPADVLWGVLTIDSSVLMSGPMYPRDYGVGVFPEMSAGYLNRAGNTAAFEPQPAVDDLLWRVENAFGMAVLDIYLTNPDAPAPPTAEESAVASFHFSTADLGKYPKLAGDKRPAYLAAFQNGCPDNLVPAQ